MLQSWNSVTMDERNDIVFENRNQEYGAYVIRRGYNGRVTLIVGGVIVFAILLYLMQRCGGAGKIEDTQETLVNTTIDITPPPPVEEIPPPPPPPPPPPMVEMVRFVPPVIKDDAKEEEPQKTIEEVKDIQVGQKDQEGDKDIVAPPTEEKGPAETAAPEIFTVVEEMPEFPGGTTAMMKYIQQNIQYPAMAREAGISGKVYLKFVVNETGEISSVEVMKGVAGCQDCDKEAIRVVKSMPKWKPGKMTGRAVKVNYTLPINFTIR